MFRITLCLCVFGLELSQENKLLFQTTSSISKLLSLHLQQNGFPKGFGGSFNIECHLTSMEINIAKIKWPHGHLFFTTIIPLPVKMVFMLKWAPVLKVPETDITNIYKFRFRFHWSFFPKGQINNIPALYLIMAWHRLGDKPLSEPMMVNLLIHICTTRPQCFKAVITEITDIYIYIFDPLEDNMLTSQLYLFPKYTVKHLI